MRLESLLTLTSSLLALGCGAPSASAPAPEGERARAAAPEEVESTAGTAGEAPVEAAPWELDRPSPLGVRTCPLATSVHRAAWARPEERRTGPGSWAVPVGYGMVDDEDYDGVPDEAVSPDGLRVGTIARARIEALGMMVLPGRVWLMRAGQPPCAATVTRYEGELVAHGLTNIQVMAVLRGCSTEADATSPQAWVSTEEPVNCNLVEPTLLSSATVIEDGSSTLPAHPAPLPRGYAPPSSAAECGEACTMLHSIRLAHGAPDVAEVWITRTDGLPADEPCSWSCDDFVALEVRGRDETMRVAPYPVIDDFARTMTLAGLLVDASGTRVVLLTDHAASGAFELDDDGLVGAGTFLREFVGSEEDGVDRSLCPYCGP